MNVLLICTCNLSSSNNITTPAWRKHAHMTDNLPKQAALTAQMAAPVHWWGHFWEKQMTSVCVCVCVWTYCSKTTPVRSKTTVFPHDPFSLQLSGYASLFQDDSLTTSFQELNQCPQSVYDGGIDCWWKKKKKRERDKEPRDNREFTEASIQSTKQKMINSVWFQSADITWFDFV